MRRSARILEKEESLLEGAKFSCPTCGKKFSQTSNMNRHVEEVHVKRLIWKCSLCNKSFVRLRGLERHESICNHKQCNICQVSFNHRDDLIEHKQNVHGESQQVCPAETFQCSICKKSFSRKDKLNDHNKEVHQGQRFKCPQCSASYTQKAKLKNHMKEGKHKKKKQGIKCAEEPKKFNKETEKWPNQGDLEWEQVVALETVLTELTAQSLILVLLQIFPSHLTQNQGENFIFKRIIK